MNYYSYIPIYNGKNNSNLKNCNKKANRIEFGNSLRKEVLKPLKTQLEEVERINKICIDNGVDTIVISHKNSRESVRSLIKSKRYELMQKGIRYEDASKVHCRDCKYFKCNIGNTGMCKITKFSTKGYNSCSNGDTK